MLILTNEEKIILLLSRLNFSREDTEAVRQLVSGNRTQINFGKIIQLAAHNGVAPLLYRNLRKIGVFPDKELWELGDIYYRAMARNFRQVMELLRLLDTLKTRGIDAIPFKGPLASELIFKNPGLYYGADIDILVKPSDLQQAKRILIDSGYGYDEKYEQEMLSSHYHLVFHKDDYLVEVHWNLVKRYFNIPPEFWWEDTYEERYNGRGILCLSPEKHLICTIFRLFSHMFNPLKFLVLVSELCNKYYERIDWHRFRRFSEEYGMGKLVRFTLRLSSELLGTKVPENIKNTNVPGYNFFRTSVINQLFRDVRRPFVSKLLFIFLMESPFHIFSYFLTRIFPKRDELRLRYGIPQGSRAIPVYYVLNPFLLPFLVLRKGLNSPSLRAFSREKGETPETPPLCRLK